jgi:hypothetical protein
VTPTGDTARHVRPNGTKAEVHDPSTGPLIRDTTREAFTEESARKEKIMRRTAVLAGLVLVGGLLGPSTAFAGEERQASGEDQWIAVTDNFVVVLPDGQTFTGDPQGGPEEAPAVGTQLFISEVLYSTEDGKTRGDQVGRTHIQCTAQAVAFNFLCEAAFVFSADSQLLVSAHLDFSTPEGGTSDIAVTGGTGDWFGATGAVSITDLSTENESVSLYEADVLLPHE